MLPEPYYRRPAPELAAALLGCELVRRTPDGVAAGIIVETEAYTQNDPASHSFKGMTQRNAAMFGPAGHAYVYFTYGMHYCVNAVATHNGIAEAVLIRALQPTQGLELMRQRRCTDDARNLCSGPARLVQALGIGPSDNGASLTTSDFHILPRRSTPTITVSPRIGIRQATDIPWRFYMPDNPFVTSHRFNRHGVPWEA